MKKSQKILAFLVCLAMFAAALAVSFLFSRDDTGDFQGSGSGHIVLSEILTSNKTYPDANGLYLDFIEVRNLSASPTDISGYMLSDGLDSIGYTFPMGTVLPGHGYIAVWCNKEADTGEYAAFGISKDGGETVYLYNSANVIVDSVSVPRMNSNMPLLRQEDGSWDLGAQATPGFENTNAGYEAWLLSMHAKDSIQVVISEIMTGNTCTALDSTGKVCDWVELHNTGSAPAVLDGAYLSDDPADAFKWQIPALTIQPGERVVIRCVGSNPEMEEATFALPRSGCTVVLTGTMGNTLCAVTVPEIGTDHSWALADDGSYAECALATPGFENTQNGYDLWLAAIDPRDIPVVISEVMTSNLSTITNSAGLLCDWIELTNTGSEPAVLDGAYLSDDPDQRSQWQIPSLTLQPGQSVVIPCSGSAAAAGEATFALKKSGCTITLTAPSGNTVHTLEVPVLDDDRSWARSEDGTYAVTDAPTPGYANNDAGREAFLLTQVPSGALVISEVMPSNAQFLQQSDGKCYDWVELQNISDVSINLADYCLSNDPDFPALMALPQQTLEPGERIVVICSGNTALSGTYIHAPFTISRTESWIYVTYKDGGFSDYMRICDVPYQGSIGKVTGENGTYYFTEPTPGTENGTGVAFISHTPQILTQDGVFNDVDSITVEISGSDTIRYTLDGSLPTANSPIYTEPIILTSTTVVRAAGFGDGKLRSDVVTGAYIINENHTLPVISVATDSENLFGPGIYTNYWSEDEVLCNLKLFEGDTGFTIDCGLKMFGHTGLKDPKKSFKVNFRGRYGEDMLHYPVYGEDAPQYYDSLIIRAGQDYPISIFRDELFTSLCRDTGNNVLAQRNKYCILYINGQYWGIYCMKEAFSETMYATNYNVSVDSVEMIQAPVNADSEMFQFMKYCWNHDLSDPEAWEYVSSRVNIDSLIDWMIMEGYSTNTDVQQNLRYFRSTERGNKYEFAFYDIDWGFYFNCQFTNLLSPEEEWQHMSISRGFMENPQFRQKFLERLSYLMETTLSDEHVLARIDYYAELLDPEVERERDRWGSNYTAWQNRVQELRDFVNDNHLQKMVDSLRRYIGLTNAEAQTYFGRWSN